MDSFIVCFRSATNTYSVWVGGMQLDAAMILDATIPQDLPVRGVVLIVALALDALVGEPPWLRRRIPHPVVLFGRAIAGMDKLLNRPLLRRIRLKGKVRRVLGVLAILLLVGMAATIGGGIAAAASAGGMQLSITIELLVVTILLAGRSLTEHARVVANALENGTIKEAREAVTKIVGRNPEALDKHGIARATVESSAENLSDGLVAPALFYIAFGLPGIFAYKMLNTADSMIGYRSARHLAFGWGAAQFDDIANLIPARLTGLLIAFTRPERAWRVITVMLRDAPNHSSPNAGWPESAMAAQLGRSLAGPRLYGHRMSRDLEINKGAPRTMGPADICFTLILMWRAIVLFAILLCVFSLGSEVYSIIKSR